jgi:hypothetical protein
LQYPPSIKIRKEADGKFSYTGYTVDTINYIGRALNIR